MGLLLLPALSQAAVLIPGQTIQVRTTDNNGIALTRAQGGGPFRVDLPGVIDDFLTFCLEKNEPIALDQNITIQSISNRAVNGGNAGVIGGGDPISATTAFIYTQFLAGVAGYQDAMTLQHAIWTLEDEEPIFNDSVTALLALASTHMIAQNWGPNDLGSIVVLNLLGPVGAPNQDLLGSQPGGPNPQEPIPEPTSMLLLGTGLATTAWLRRRRAGRGR
jgi:hypothetical protein